jgi:hypothetical protein
LTTARDERDKIRTMVAQGINPSENRKAVKLSKTGDASNSFEVIARKWGQKKIDDWQEKSNRTKRMLERDIFPWLGPVPITSIKPMNILECLRRVDAAPPNEDSIRFNEVQKPF